MAKTLVYQMYIPALGSIRKAINFLSAPAHLGADVVWLSGMLDSPGFDHGYDISDYKKVNPRFGTMHDLENFISLAHQIGIKVITDLVLNHTSTEHEWFRTHPEYYFWSDTDPENSSYWQNLFGYESAWRLEKETGKFYLHLFHEKQADLNWFPDGKHVNSSLVEEFQKIVEFWTEEIHVDGFRLDVPQAMNKTPFSEDCTFKSLIHGYLARDVLTAIFPDPCKAPFLIMECFDPSENGDIVKRYSDLGPIDFIMNVSIKDLYPALLSEKLRKYANNPYFMLDLESHDSPRFLSRFVLFEDELQYLFSTGVEAVCLYQGQELGLTNPDKQEMSNALMLALDAQAAISVTNGANIEELRPTSRANARVLLSLEGYSAQIWDSNSPFNQTCRAIEAWRKDI